MSTWSRQFRLLDSGRREGARRTLTRHVAWGWLLRAFSPGQDKVKRASMVGESPTQAGTPGGAVFLSYASQDARAAQTICEALRAGGIEVWFDQGELRGGDAWDQSIRKHIKTCALFIPVVSRHTHERAEGYFRLEWKLAVDRSHLFMANRAFLLPVVVDDTSEHDEHVPEKFHEVQWTRLPGGEPPPGFVDHVRRLLAGEAPALRADRRSGAIPAIMQAAPALGWAKRLVTFSAATAVLGLAAYLAIDRPSILRPAGAPSTERATTTPAFKPPPHSIAVLPFVNMSGDKEQEYFSEGLTEELLNSLSRIDELQVAARTSSFSFQSEHPDIATVAHKLNVGAVLEGSVRRSGNTVRITTQLINGVTGFHLWSESYDRSLGDVLKLQTEIATAVAQSLKVTLLGDLSQKIELGGTRNPAAFDAYLRGKRIGNTTHGGDDIQAAIAAYTEAIRLDSRYAQAFAERSIVLSNYASFYLPDPAAVHTTFANALADARTATTLTPDLALGYYALGVALRSSLQFPEADDAFARALALAPGSARILAAYSRHAAEYGQTQAAVDAGRRATALDPLNFQVHRTVGIALLGARQYPAALVAFQTAISLQPDYLRGYVLIGETQYLMGAYDAALKSCEALPADQLAQRCLAMTDQKLGRNSDAEAMLLKLKSVEGDAGACDYAAIYAQWGDAAKAMAWLETAVRLRDPSLIGLNREQYFDPLRREARFQAIVRDLKLPQ